MYNLGQNNVQSIRGSSRLPPNQKVLFKKKLRLHTIHCDV